MMKRILVVEDDELFRKSLYLFLTTLGYDVVAVEYPVQALKIVAEQMPDLIVTDYQLPEMTGVEMAKSIRNHGRHVPVVLISGYLSEEVQADAHAAGIDAMLKKPAELANLRDVLPYL